MKTAGEVNAAILESLSQGREAKLVALLKLLQWGEALLEERAEFPKVRAMTGDASDMLIVLLKVDLNAAIALPSSTSGRESEYI